MNRIHIHGSVFSKLQICPILLSLLFANMINAEEETSIQENCCMEVEKAKLEYLAGQERLESSFRKATAKAIMRANRAEVFLLEFDLNDALQIGQIGASGHGYGQLLDKIPPGFPIYPYGKLTPIILTKELTPPEKDFALLQKKVTNVVEDIRGSATSMGHFPVYGVRFYCSDGNEIVLESSFCFKFKTMFIRYPGHGRYAIWHDIPMDGLEDLLNRLMPKPRDYTDRYENFWKNLTRKIESKQTPAATSDSNN